MLKLKKLNQKLVVSFLTLSLVPLVLFAIINLNIASSALKTSSFNQLESIREVKKLELSNYIESLKSSLIVLQNDPYAAESFMAFKGAFDKSGTLGPDWLKAESNYAARFKEINDVNAWYDLFFIDLEGNIIFTAAKESDLGESVRSSLLSQTSMGDAFTQAKSVSNKEVAVSDFKPYPPSNDDPAAFMMTKLVNGDNQNIGYIALQFPVDKVNHIMQQRDGMGESGETYLVGQDKLMRSDSYLDPKNHSVIASFAGNVENNGVDTDAVVAAFNGETDNRIIIDYNGNPVLSSFTTLNIGEFKWALIAEIDEVEAFDAAHTLANVSYGLIAATILVIVVFALWISNSISAPIILSSKAAQRVSEGDLTVAIDVNQHNELGMLQQSMQDMINKLKTMIEHIAESAEQQTISSEKLAVITEQTNQNMIRQHSATDQVATAMAQMSASIDDVSNNTEAVSKASDESKKLVLECSVVVQDAVTCVDDLSGNLESSKQLIGDVQDGTAKIVSILDVIKSIADQTNLLALNAAIEAARAGEDGRGFSVVADEVRMLAQNTQNSTVEIETMIQSLVVKVKEATESMDKGAEQTKSIVDKTQKVTQSLDDVGRAVNNIADMNIEIANATLQQSDASKDISKQTLEISDVSDETEQSTKEIMDTSKELMLLAEQLSAQVQQFKWA